jgi:hypothetical protein
MTKGKVTSIREWLVIDILTSTGVRVSERLKRIPKLYETEHVPLSEKLIFLHFFLFGCDWYVSEYDGDDFFLGFVILNTDIQNAEWGYFSFSELRAIKFGRMEIDCELEAFWKIRSASEVDKIMTCHYFNEECKSDAG